MATDATSTTETSAGSTAPSTSSFGTKNLLMIGVLIAFVMIAEAAVFYLLGIGIGNSSGEQQKADVAAVQEEEQNQEEQFVEVFIDTFNVTNTTAAADAIFHISFKLTALVAKGQEVDFDNAANKTHKARVREVVVEVARSATIEDLNDPELSSFKRMLRERINKVLQRSYVVEAIISDFQVIEQ